MRLKKWYISVLFLAIALNSTSKEVDSIRIWHDMYHSTSPRIVAHRGFYNYPGAAQNSRASLRNAIRLGVEGSEMDVWLTADNEIVVNHDAVRDGVTIETSTLKEVRKLKLGNGERLPLFGEFLRILKTSKKTHLFVEVKKHSTRQRTIEAGLAAMRAVNAAGLKGMAEYMSFSLPACVALAKEDPSAKVYYLSGNKSPQELHALGISSMNYKAEVYRKHPTWIRDAHSLGMTVTARALNTRNAVREMIEAGVDNMATDFPVQAMDVRELMTRNKK